MIYRARPPCYTRVAFLCSRKEEAMRGRGSNIARFLFSMFLLTLFFSVSYAQNKPNGAQCRSSKECSSGHCYPGPSKMPIAKDPNGGGTWYCLHKDLHCAVPNGNGAGYYNVLPGSNLVCMNPAHVAYISPKFGGKCEIALSSGDE
jgi:hypothetical protein